MSTPHTKEEYDETQPNLHDQLVAATRHARTVQDDGFATVEKEQVAELAKTVLGVTTARRHISGVSNPGGVVITTRGRIASIPFLLNIGRFDDANKIIDDLLNEQK